MQTRPPWLPCSPCTLCTCLEKAGSIGCGLHHHPSTQCSRPLYKSRARELPLAGAQAGTLTPANAGDGMLTLTGWSAALGLLAIVVVTVVGAGLAYRRYKGYDQMSTYTLVNKTPGRS